MIFEGIVKENFQHLKGLIKSVLSFQGTYSGINLWVIGRQRNNRCYPGESLVSSMNKFNIIP